MKRSRIALPVAVFAAVFIAAAQTSPLEVLSRTSLGPLSGERVIYRASVCANGTSVVTNNNGEMTLVDSSGAILANRVERAELAGAVASGCDEQGLLYVSAPPLIRVYEFPQAREPVLRNSIRISGAPERILAVKNQLFIVGLARAENRHVFLRRFSLPEGKLEGMPAIDLPLGSGRQLNMLLLLGSLLWHPQREQVIYVPANPFEFWCLDLEGRVVETRRPPTSRFQNADLSGSPASSPADWRSFDWVQNAVCLPDGRIAVQWMTGRRAPKSESYLEVYYRNLTLETAGMPLTSDFGHLLGADRAGNLYFANLRMGGSSIVKARLR
ncbi:MAG: hypothetical protein IT158_02540 [Bryobacterales bacterium]|nr:hypothetical protein [Bryobacterales bacterium]